MVARGRWVRAAALLAIGLLGLSFLHGGEEGEAVPSVSDTQVQLNNFGPNLALPVMRDRQRNASKDELK
jgi:hypothetical protein